MSIENWDRYGITPIPSDTAEDILWLLSLDQVVVRGFDTYRSEKYILSDQFHVEDNYVPLVASDAAPGPWGPVERTQSVVFVGMVSDENGGPDFRVVSPPALVLGVTRPSPGWLLVRTLVDDRLEGVPYRDLVESDPAWAELLDGRETIVDEDADEIWAEFIGEDDDDDDGVNP